MRTNHGGRLAHKEEKASKKKAIVPSKELEQSLGIDLRDGAFIEMVRMAGNGIPRQGTNCIKIQNEEHKVCFPYP